MKKKCIIVDLEGTISDHSHRLHHLEKKDYDEYNAEFINDSVNEKFVNEILIDQPSDVDIILCTAKSIEYEHNVYAWLQECDLYQYFYKIYFRKQSDNGPSVLVKEDQFANIKQRYDVICAYDDRVDNINMYRRNGVKAFLVKCHDLYTPKFAEPLKPLFTPDIILKECAETFKAKNEEYGDGYKNFGKIMMGFFPDGLSLKTESDFTRFAIFNISISKIDRYSKNFEKGGHKDSLNDLAVYSAMLNEVDNGS